FLKIYVNLFTLLQLKQNYMLRLIKRVVLITTIACACINYFSYGQMEVYKAKPIENIKPANEVKLNNQKIPDNELRNINFFIRKWRTGVSGAVYETTDAVTNQRKITTSTGTAKVDPLYINANGTYYWATYGQKKSGRWEKTGRTDYPIVLRKAIDGRDWLVGRDTRKVNLIYIWDGKYYSYTAVPM
ncbi:MAG TPA: hypothetical protein VHP12_09750, partial [Chitinophagaceae bacterium]|nr:hypothetical protein [Chitinophagaceae bacterium]